MRILTFFTLAIVAFLATVPGCRSGPGSPMDTVPNNLQLALTGSVYPGNSAQTATPDATPSKLPYPAPSGLTVLPGDVEAFLSWTPPAGAATGGGGYIVSRSTTHGGPYTQISGTLISAGPVYLDTDNESGLKTGQTYYYVVEYLDAYGNESPESAEVAATTAPVDGNWGVSVAPTGIGSGLKTGVNDNSLGNVRLSTATVSADVRGPQTGPATQTATASIGAHWVVNWIPNIPGTLPGLFVLQEDRSQSVSAEISEDESGTGSVAVGGGLSLNTDSLQKAALDNSPITVTQTLDESTPGIVNIAYTSNDRSVQKTLPGGGLLSGHSEGLGRSSEIYHVFLPGYFTSNFDLAQHVNFMAWDMPESSITATSSVSGPISAGKFCFVGGLVTDTYSDYRPLSN